MLELAAVLVFFCFKQKTAYEMRISDWSSDVCSSDLIRSCSVCASLAAAFTGNAAKVAASVSRSPFTAASGRERQSAVSVMPSSRKSRVKRLPAATKTPQLARAGTPAPRRRWNHGEAGLSMNSAARGVGHRLVGRKGDVWGQGVYER